MMFNFIKSFFQKAPPDDGDADGPVINTYLGYRYEIFGGDHPYVRIESPPISVYSGCRDVDICGLKFIRELSGCNVYMVHRYDCDKTADDISADCMKCISEMYHKEDKFLKQW